CSSDLAPTPAVRRHKEPRAWRDPAGQSPHSAQALPATPQPPTRSKYQATAYCALDYLPARWDQRQSETPASDNDKTGGRRTKIAPWRSACSLLSAEMPDTPEAGNALA